MTLKNKTAFILLPGFAPDSYPMMNLQNELTSLGHYAVAMPFWGDTKVENFSNLTIEQCEIGISKIISSLLKDYDSVIGIGISLGGALLIEHSKKHKDLSLIVSIGTPFKMKNRMLIKFLSFIYPVIRVLWKIGDKMGIQRMLPMDSAKMVLSYLENDFLKDLDKVTTPLLLLHSTHDAVTDYKAVPFFMEKIMSKEKKVIYFENVNHVMGYDNQIIVKSIADHFSTNA